MLALQRFIVASAAFALFGTTACSNPLEDEEHGDAVGVDVTDMSGGLIASYRTTSGEWTFTTSDALEVAVGASRQVRVFFVAADGDRYQEPASGSEHTYRVLMGNEAIAEFSGEDNHGRFDGIAAGETTATVQLIHGGHEDYQTEPGMTVRVIAPN